ncbi:MAG TPA: formate dehydrogenase accessory sulfurtransferase FdhD [Methylomirabilota bacterium]|nr:formate dehydrogenase accessory sulfurtransferase FdhD [Methylomirabilota bacterium]
MSSEQKAAVVQREVRTWEQGVCRNPRQDFVTREEPLEIRVRGQSVAITMRTPGDDDELAAGFLFTEGVVKHRSDIRDIAYCTTAETDARGNILNVFLSTDAQFDPARLSRHVFANSSCGICGKASLEAVHQQFPRIRGTATVTPAMLCKLPGALRDAQQSFAETGGLHGAGLFSLTGELLIAREDVGRHNAVDKVIGAAFLKNQLPLRDAVMLVSGRVSFEIAQKTLAAGIPILAAVSAPSSLAIELAEESGQSLIGFLRGERFNVYTHPQRVVSASVP